MFKQKLTIKEQIAHIKSKNIKFDLINEEKAAEFISSNSYYFKIKAYAKNFSRNSEGKYNNLDFAYLIELSTLDMHLRRMILHLTINLEHMLKVCINSHFCSNSAEDGYAIVDSFKKSRPNRTVYNSNKYTKALYEKYSANPAIWNFVEMINFGELIDFYKHYFNLYDKDLYDLNVLLFCAKQLRNAAAHSNCLLINMTAAQVSNSNTKIRITEVLRSLLIYKGISPTVLKKRLAIPILHDFAALLFCFFSFNKSCAVQEKTIKELKELIVRFNRNKDYFIKHNELKTNLDFFDSIVEILV